jgi:stearoyl-CoA desaturase (delta-9 desaturase)
MTEEILIQRVDWRSKGIWAMLILHLGSLPAFLPQARPTVGVLMLALGAFVVRNFCISAGFHRYFSHHSFRTSRFVQFLFAFIGGMAFMRGALWWASHHRKHHRFADREGDPHSPGAGFWWAHFKWFMVASNQPTDYDRVKEFTKYPELVWLDRHDWFPLLVFVVFCCAVGGFPGWVWGVNVSTLVLVHSTFSINSFSHWLGRRRYDDLPDTSTNNLPVAIMSFGEGWHNNHHKWPHRARLGETAGEIDVTWYGLWALEKLGVVRDLARE